jgi:protein TonB
MRSWVAKVARVGPLHSPEQARRLPLAGALVLSVDVLADGSVEQIRVLRSSGYDILDEAAVRIVRLSSPFSPLPEEITREVDVLTITRTWQFSSQSGLY